jgi:quercetin dioxygenase-like cupin family protein
MSYNITPASALDLRPVAWPGATGLADCTMLSAAHGSVHTEAAISELAPGGSVAGHLHPFEESFYVLSGRPLLALGGRRYQLRPGDFGFAPVGLAHAWSNPGGEPARWLRVRAPQPRPIGQARGTYASGEVAPPRQGQGRPPDETDPTCHFVGHFSDEDMGAPGPLAMPGYHGHNVRNISIRMMVDDILGAQHHTLFMVRFVPGGIPGRLTAKEHFHPFEEVYYLLEGQARGWLDGEVNDVAAGDMVWTSTNGSHGFINTGDGPLRWLEVQAPAPPPSGAFFFLDDWKQLERPEAAR